MDFSPWPDGLGFEGADKWWEYVLAQSEQERLDLLFAVALLSSEIALLLLKHDRILLNRFEFSEPMTTLLLSIEATTLTEFARAVVLKRGSL